MRVSDWRIFQPTLPLTKSDYVLHNCLGTDYIQSVLVKHTVSATIVAWTVQKYTCVKYMTVDTKLVIPTVMEDLKLFCPSCSLSPIPPKHKLSMLMKRSL